MRAATLLLLLFASTCTQPDGPAPSLAPRPAEAIDPRFPVEEAPATGTVDPTLSARLSELVAQARAGDGAFQQAAVDAERLIAAAGDPRSEGWVVAQQALSAAVAAHAPTTRAMGDIDALAAEAIARQGWIAPADQAAIEAASAEVWRISSAQAARIDAMRARLGG